MSKKNNINPLSQNLTPTSVVEELNKYIIGQSIAKKAVAIALRNRWRRLSIATDLQKEIMPNNILMIGATGVGKTEIARRLAKLADAPFIKVEASKFTEVGYVGRDVESMVRDLLEYSINMVKSKHREVCLEKATSTVNGQLLDLLMPNFDLQTLQNFAKATQLGLATAKKSKKVKESDSLESAIFIGENFEYDFNESDKKGKSKMMRDARKIMKEKLLSGEMEDTIVEMEVTSGESAGFQLMGPFGLDAADGIQELLSGFSGKKKKKRKLPVSEAREILIETEVQKLIDLDAVHKEAIYKAEQSGVIFIDEIDKIVSRGKSGNSADVSREGVQRDLLPIIEGTVVATKYGSLKTDHILFIAAGAFHVSKPSELIPELQGRLPIRVELSPLSKDDFVKILTIPQNALIKQYKALLDTEGVELIFEDDAIDELASIAFQVNQEIENIGARRLHTVMSNLLEDILYNVPDQNNISSFIITKEFVREKLSKITQSKDLSQYIL